MYLEWNSSFSVGIRQFDEEHRKIIEFINNLHDAIQTGESTAALADILSGLVEYTMTHFSHEEELMKEYKYPAAERHREQHDDLFVKVNEYKTRFRTEREGISDELMAFLKDWLVHHIMNTDRAYTEFFKSAGVN